MTVLTLKPTFPHDQVTALLKRHGLALDDHSDAFPLAGDGSDRGFSRIRLSDGRLAIVVVPSATHPKALAEARSVISIGTHLHSRNVPVPTLYAADEQSGVVVFEDVGDQHLATWVAARQHDESTIRRMYQRVLSVLLQMQTGGAEGFRPQWCWDTPVYDRQVMRQRESDYFLDSFGRGLLGYQTYSPYLVHELDMIADRAAHQPAGYFLHRDFQSRNLMITDLDDIRIIDYQGGRLGPLGYDLASLLIDPYVPLSLGLKEELFLFYLDRLAEQHVVDRDHFRQGFWYLSLQRNMQILGAFAFLSAVKKKKFFSQFIAAALASLGHLLTDREAENTPHLTALVASMTERLAQSAAFHQDSSL